MGIPKFYRYLSERYPLINEVVTSPQYLPVCDYLYLDLNGVIHNATHGNSITQGVKSEETVAEYIMGYISHIFKQMKPRKVMFIAVDGVAPRAKLNQQRSRRFRSALDSRLEREATQYTGASFDSNCITPGTEFMYKVDRILEYFINKKLLEDPLWRNTKVIYSSHSDPGEGEHKIMAYIRSYYTDPNHSLTERHCIYGLDADLILLSLSLHDVNVVLLREVINFFTFMNNEEIEDRAISQSHWQILHVGMLREYLLSDLVPADKSWIQKHDTERLIDDFVFLMILLGDDFLPELPSLDINEGSIQLLVDLYKDVIANVKGFLVEDAKPVLPVLKIILTKIGEIEEELFSERLQRKREKQKKGRKGHFEERKSSPPSKHPELAEPGGLPVIKSDTYVVTTLGPKASNYRDRYYFEKLNLRLPEHNAILDDVCKCYYEGLQWILFYYYRGIPSWGWYYPYHYSPLACDLASFDMLYQPFLLEKPFTPFLQQLGCLPPQSAPILPKSYRRLVLDADSPIIQFYPPDFCIDMNDKVNPWEGVNLIPFIDEAKLRKAIRDFECDSNLTDEEKQRNQFRPASIFSTEQIMGKVTVSLPFASTLFPPFSCPLYRKDYVIPKPQGKQECIIHCSALPGSFFIPLRQRSITEDHLGIVATGRVSKHATVILNIPNKLPEVSHAILATLAGNSCDKIVHYPVGHHRCAWVNSLYTRTKRAFIEEGHVELEDLSSEELEIIGGVFDQMPHHALVGKQNVIGLGGMNIGTVSILAELYPVIGSQRDPTTGKVEFRYASDSILYPYHLLSAGVTRQTQGGFDHRFCFLPSLPLSQLVQPNSPCVFLGPGQFNNLKLLGCGGFIKSIDDQKVRIQLIHSPLNTHAGHDALKKMKAEKWYSISQLQRMLQLSNRGVVGLIGYYPVFGKSKKYGHIGLNLVVRDKVAPRFVQCSMRKQEYSEDFTTPLPYAPLAVPFAELDDLDKSFMNDIFLSKDTLHLLMDYRNAFTWLFERIRDSDTSHEFDDLFTNENEFYSVIRWLEEHRITTEPMMDSQSLCCSQNQANVLQQAGAILHRKRKPVKVNLSCPHKYITFWEREYMTVSPQEEKKLVPAIGDRLVVTGGNDVPFGSYGFVLAVHPRTHMVEVVMDKPFIGGTNLHGLLNVEGRGAVLPWECCYPLK